MASPGGRHGAPQLWLQAMQASISPAPAPAPAVTDGCYMVRRWIDWQIQTLVLVSFLLQVLLLLFARMRRRKISIIPRTLLWLAYLLADSIATYILGHMSFFGKSQGHKQLMAFWAPFLLVHLGGQDNITAYSIEDNQLWPRHMLSFVVEMGGVAYVLGKYVAGSRTLVIAAMLMFVSGVLKYGERVWALKSSSLDNMSKFLDKRKLSEAKREPLAQWGQQGELDPEEVLHGAHDLLPICMAQFVDYKFWPSESGSRAIKLFNDKGQIFELIEMQLSLMHDFLYTKAAVVATWYGCFIRVISSIASISTLVLFRSSIGKNDFERVDIIVTYILILGAVVLEITAFLRAMVSAWTCASLHAGRWYWSHKIVVYVRRYLKSADRNRRWSGFIGQPELLNSSHGSGGCAQSLGCKDLWKKLHHSLPVISDGTKRLVLDEVRRLVEACEGKEDVMRSYSSQCALNPWRGFFKDPTSQAGIDFDDKILSWYFATKTFLSLSSRVEEHGNVVEAIEAMSNYMIFLLVEHPYMLPSPARPGSYANIEETCVALDFSDRESISRKLGLDRRRRMRDLDTRTDIDELQRTREKLDIIRDDLDKLREDQDQSLKDLCIKWKGLYRGRRYSYNRVELYGTKEELHRSIEELKRRWKELNRRRGELDDLRLEVGGRRQKLEVLDEIKKDLELDIELYLYARNPKKMFGRRSSKVDGGREENLDLDEDKHSLSRTRIELDALVRRRSEVDGRQEENLNMEVLNRTMKKLEELDRRSKELHLGPSPPLARGAELVFWLLEAEARGEQEVQRVLLGVWVEMLCYAAHHCSRDSHARQLNNGGEFITIVWLLSTAMFNGRYCDEAWFNRGVWEFFRPPFHFEKEKKAGWFHRLLFSCGLPPYSGWPEIDIY